MYSIFVTVKEKAKHVSNLSNKCISCDYGESQYGKKISNLH